MNKKLWALCLVVAMGVSAVAGAAFAYYAAADGDTDTFTMGKVSVEVIQSPFDRTNSSVAKINTAHLDSYFTDEQILFQDEIVTNNDNFADVLSCNSYEEYLALFEDGLDTGDEVSMCTYVSNTGTVDAYVRVVIWIPCELLDEKVIDFYWNYAGEELGETGKVSASNGVKVDTDNDGVVDCYEYVVVYEDVLGVGEMTFYNATVGFSIRSAVNQDLLDEYLVGGIFDIEVYAEAIQAEGFDSATDAFAEYDK